MEEGIPSASEQELWLCGCVFLCLAKSNNTKKPVINGALLCKYVVGYGSSP